MEADEIEVEMGRRGWFISTDWDHDDCADPDDDGETTRAIEAGTLERLVVILRAEDGRFLDSLGSVIVAAGDYAYVDLCGREMAEELILSHRECHARVTCGNCGHAWCERCDPAPAALCHWCHGRGSSTAELAPASEEGANV